MRQRKARKPESQAAPAQAPATASIQAGVRTGAALTPERIKNVVGGAYNLDPDTVVATVADEAVLEGDEGDEASNAGLDDS